MYTNYCRPSPSIIYWVLLKLKAVTLVWWHHTNNALSACLLGSVCHCMLNSFSVVYSIHLKTLALQRMLSKLFKPLAVSCAIGPMALVTLPLDPYSWIYLFCDGNNITTTCKSVGFEVFEKEKKMLMGTCSIYGLSFMLPRHLCAHTTVNFVYRYNHFHILDFRLLDFILDLYIKHF